MMSDEVEIDDVVVDDTSVEEEVEIVSQDVEEKPDFGAAI
jgi:hypothetical protein